LPNASRFSQAQPQVQRQAQLALTLKRLDATSNDALKRWSSPEDFRKVDLVVASLMQQGNVDAAMLYLRKVCTITAQISVVSTEQKP
jgi:hypothetical protein